MFVQDILEKFANYRYNFVCAGRFGKHLRLKFMEYMSFLRENTNWQDSVSIGNNCSSQMLGGIVWHSGEPNS